MLKKRLAVFSLFLTGIILLFSSTLVAFAQETDAPYLEQAYTLEFTGSAVTLPQVKNNHGKYSYKISLYAESDPELKNPVASDLTLSYTFEKEGKYFLKYHLVSGSESLELTTTIMLVKADDGEDTEDEPFPVWTIVLISVGSALILAGAVTAAILIIKNKKKGGAKNDKKQNDTTQV